jgi:Fe-S-cluster formation regulator IscX/YfhJ
MSALVDSGPPLEADDDNAISVIEASVPAPAARLTWSLQLLDHELIKQFNLYQPPFATKKTECWQRIAENMAEAAKQVDPHNVHLYRDHTKVSHSEMFPDGPFVTSCADWFIR